MNEDTRRIARDIERRLEAIAMKSTPDDLNSELEQVIALALLTAPREIQDLVWQARKMVISRLLSTGDGEHHE